MGKGSYTNAKVIKPIIQEILSDGKAHTREEMIQVVKERVNIGSEYTQNVLSYMITKGDCVRLSRGVYCKPCEAEVSENNLDEKVILDLYEKFYGDCMSYISGFNLWQVDKKNANRLISTKEFCQRGMSELKNLWR